MAEQKVIKKTGRNLPNPVCPPDATRQYEKERYAHLDQKIVNILEHKVITTLLSSTQVENGTILNVPCGFGRFTDLIRSYFSYIHFFDLHPKMVERCREQFPAAHNTFCNGSIRELPYKNNCVDMVFTIRFFHHYFKKEDRISMLKELHRVTRKYAILTYYDETVFHSIMKKLNNKGHKILMMKRREFYNELQSVGFKPVIEKTLIPVLHAQRFLLLEKIN